MSAPRISPRMVSSFGFIGRVVSSSLVFYCGAVVSLTRRPDDRDLDRRRILPRMVHGVTRDDALRLVVIVAACVQVAIEAREVAARDFDANAMAGFEVVARHHRPERYLVDLAIFHPDLWLVVTVAIAHALNGLV